MAKMGVEVIQCDRGHYYLSSLSQCPACAKGISQEENIPENKVPPVKENVVREPERVPEKKPGPFDIQDYEPTTPVQPEGAAQIDPVVGFLVCIKGANRGKYYRLHSGTNFIGRSEKMDVRIENDDRISRENAASVSYDDRSGIFYMERGEGRNSCYLNGQVVRSDADLNGYDRIEIGGTTLLFVPLCGDRFSWKNV